MKILKTHNLTVDENFNFFHHSNSLAENSHKKLNNIGGILIHFNDNSEFEFISYLKTFLFEIVDEYNIYFIIMDDAPKKKNSIRTHKKNLYKKIPQLGKNNVFETEKEIEEGKSIIASIIRLDRRNFDYFFHNVYGSKILTGYISRKDKKTFKSRKELLENLISERMEKAHQNLVDFASLSQILVKKNAFVFRVFMDGQDGQNIELYLSNEEVEEIFVKLQSNNLKNMPVYLN